MIFYLFDYIKQTQSQTSQTIKCCVNIIHTISSLISKINHHKNNYNIILTQRKTK